MGIGVDISTVNVVEGTNLIIAKYSNSISGENIRTGEDTRLIKWLYVMLNE